MLKAFVVFFMIMFTAVGVACAINGGAWDAPEWLMGECLAVAAVGALFMRYYGPRLFPVVDEFEFDEVEDDEEIEA